MQMSEYESIPALFRERLQHLVTPEQYEQVLHSFSVSRPLSFRANTLKISAAELAEELKTAQVPISQIPWYKDAFILSSLEIQQLIHPRYVDGSLYVQSLSSMVPALVLDPQPSDLILDLTAAPGSKTTQIAAMMGNAGQIIANELSLVRIFKLQANLKKQGVTNTVVRRSPGEFLWKKFSEYFDRSLVDAPCSMEGRFSLSDPETYEDWSYKKIKELSMRQSHLLRSAVTATRPGGVIVYSTCTLAPEENEGVVNWLLEKEHGNVVLEEIQIEGLEMIPGVTEWRGKTFMPELTKTARILPSETMEGFFVAKLRKIGTSIVQQPEKRSFNRFSKKRRY